MNISSGTLPLSERPRHKSITWELTPPVPCPRLFAAAPAQRGDACFQVFADDQGHLWPRALPYPSVIAILVPAAFTSPGFGFCLTTLPVFFLTPARSFT